MAKDCVPNGVRLLVVDDDPELLHLFSQMLRKEGYDPATAHNANDALRLIGEFPNETHLLLSDVDMPGMSGIELARRMAAENPDVPVILMSGSPLPSNTDAPFLIKPFTAQELVQKIREVMDLESVARNNGKARGRSRPMRAAVACLTAGAIVGLATWLWVKKTPKEAFVQPREIPMHRVQSA